MIYTSFSARFLGVGIVGTAACVASAGIGGGYVHRRQDGLIFLRVTQVGSSLSGFMQIVRADYSNNDGTIAKTAEFAGSVSGSSFALQSDGLARVFGGGVVRTSGTVRGKGLRLSFPAASGFVAIQDFVPCTEADWNRTLSAFAMNHRLRCQQAWLVSKANEEVASEAKRAQTLQANLKTWAEEAERLSRDLANVKAEIDQKKRGVDRLADEIEKVRKRHEQAEQTVAEARRAYEADRSDANYERLDRARNEAQDIQQEEVDLDGERHQAEHDAAQAEREAERTQERRADKDSQIAFGRKELQVIEAEIKAVYAATPRLTKSVRAGKVSVATLQAGAVVRIYPDDRGRELRLDPPAWFAFFNMGNGWSLIHYPNHELGWVKTASLQGARTIITHP